MDIDEKAYYRDKLMECKNDYKQVFSVCNTLLGRGRNLPVPPCESKQQLANKFNEYIQRIDDFNSSGHDHATYIMDPPANTFVTYYRELTIDEGVKLIMRVSTKSCESDSIPTSPLKQIIHESGSYIADIINISITFRCFPSSKKGTLVRPLLKKATLDLIKKNY